ncbi:MAG: YCF48-related protein, partial [Thermoleophilia bacterium]|nr:YCF48-related protein [Thermoleophilia bacterium]
MIRKWTRAALLSALVIALAMSLSGAPAIAGGDALPSGGDGYTGWYFQNTGLPDVDDVSAANASVAWAVGTKVLKTSNGGDTWSDNWPGHTGNYLGVSVVDADTVWVIAANNDIVLTTNGGTDWTEFTTGIGASTLDEIVGIDANNAWAIGMCPSVIIRTTNGGASWDPFTNPAWGEPRSITAVSATTVWVACYDGTVLKTIDGGVNWSKNSVTTYLEGIDSLDTNTLYACGSEIRKSTNGGDTWQKVLVAEGYFLMSVTAVDVNTAWAVGIGGVIQKTLDGGKSWFQQASGTTAMLTAVCAVDSNNAWAVLLNNGYILHTTDGGGYHTPPTITAVTPSSGRAGTEVTITGAEFGSTRSQSYVSFGAVDATDYTAWSDTQINVLVPATVSGQVDIVVHTAGGASNAKTFTVITPTYYSYYFAEGCTREGFAEWLCLQNPGANPLDVNATYMLIGGQAPATKTYTLDPTSRTSINVNDAVGPGQDVSVKLIAEGEFYAERPMYFDYKQGDASYSWTGGHCATGAIAPASDWYFAEGTTRAGFEEWLCLQNPNSTEVIATVYYIMAGAYTTQKDYRLSPQSRLSVFVNGDVGPDQDVSVRVHCDSGIVAERPMYFNYHGKWDGGHDVMGTDAPK